MQLITKKMVTELSYQIINAAINVHKELGPGLLESVYEKCLKHELLERGFKIDSQIKVPINYGKISIEADLRCDLIVNDIVVVEIKAVEVLNPVYYAQVLSYMKLLQLPQGLLINFFIKNIVKSSKPFVNELFKFDFYSSNKIPKQNKEREVQLQLGL